MTTEAIARRMNVPLDELHPGIVAPACISLRAAGRLPLN
jgi:hypothetical protein